MNWKGSIQRVWKGIEMFDKFGEFDSVEELQGIKTKLCELSMIVEQLIALKEGDK